MNQMAPDWVEYHRQRSGQWPALESVDSGEVLTWTMLDDRVGRLAQFLFDSHGIRKGARIVVLAENDIRVLILQFACMRLGAIMVPLNWRLAPVELAALGQDADPAMVIHDDAWAEAADHIATECDLRRTLSWGSTQPGNDFDRGIDAASRMGASRDNVLDDPTHILYTSGTTGVPKGAFVTNKTLVWQGINCAVPSDLTGPGTKQFNPLPLFHAGGLLTLASGVLMSGGCVAVSRRFDPELCLAWLGDPERGITHFNSPPVMWQGITETAGWAGTDFSHIRHCHVAGSIMPLEMFELWRGRGVAIQQHYGGTEMGPTATALPAADAFRKVGSCGLPVMHTQIRIVDGAEEDVAPGADGEIWLNGPSVTPGYWRRPDEDCFRDGWFRTGDGAHQDDEGYFFLTDRIKDVFKSGGESVFPAEVERILLESPAIAEVAVIGISHQQWGEVGRAVVVPAAGVAMTVEDLAAHLDGRLARYKIPRSLVLVDALPRNALGKLDKKVLRATHGTA